ncbi:hypothetical protein GO001_10015 [Streptomyces sp. NRRL B-1677]|uniref:hypothetical protein n=1 Tax=Streptomyces sp. NRRL B-1677 TaxID=2682966 RepID=UPI001892CFC8|nr:hypothetical protein [Streptomyces sp. NRRL B-1677]MBF6045554.1 hypothetical protein [Streptomyces sp. NRRL B-1677]
MKDLSRGFDDLMQMEKAQDLIRGYEEGLAAKRAILANKEAQLAEGSFHSGMTAEETKVWVQHLREGMAELQQRIEQVRAALSRGPDACRSLLQQRAAEEDMFRRAFGRMRDNVVPPEPQAAPEPGGADLAPDVPAEPPRQGLVRKPGGGVGQEVPTGGFPATEAAEVPGGIGAAPEPPPVAPVAAGEEVIAGGDAAAGAGAEVVGASRLGRVLVGLVIIAGVAIGGYWAYNHFTSPPASSPSSPTATQPASFDINGDYNGTANGAACAKPECYVTVTKVSDPSGPGEDNAGKITVNFTAVNWTPASTGVASVINMKIGPMDAWLQQDGTVKETGYNPWTIITDTTPGSNSRTSGSYKLSGKFTSGTNGSPSYTLTMNVSGLDYQLVGTRAG